MTERPERLPGSRQLPWEDRPYPWGPVDKVHNIGPYRIVEHRRDMSNMYAQDYSEHGRTFFHPYVGDKDTSMSYYSLESAMVGVVAYVREGPSGSAAYYFDRMTGVDD